MPTCVYLRLRDGRSLCFGKTRDTDSALRVKGEVERWLREAMTLSVANPQGEVEDVTPTRVAGIDLVDEEEEDRTGQGVGQGRKLRVMFVDDEPGALTSLERALRKPCSDWEMMFVPSAEEALRLLARQRYDVVITDVVMRGMSGTELMRVAKDRHPSMLRVALTAMVDATVLVESRKYAQLHLLKPSPASAIREEVLKLVASVRR